MPPRKPEADRFALGEEIAKAAEPSPTPAKEKAKTIVRRSAKRSEPDAEPLPHLPAVAIRPGVRPPNVAYERAGRIYVKVPKALCRALDRAVLAEKENRDPVPMDKGIAIEESVRMWLKAKGYKSE